PMLPDIEGEDLPTWEEQRSRGNSIGEWVEKNITLIRNGSIVATVLVVGGCLFMLLILFVALKACG
ncbi:MAG: hypothetical protein HN348_24925, partial [Proteobacteria bacterium]|nr:hypothetical protein [Pseudomonadota bacterium]